MPDPTPRKPAPEEDRANEMAVMAAEIVRKHQNLIVAIVCLAILAIFGYRWWSSQKETQDQWAWRSLIPDATVETLQEALNQYAETTAAPFIRLQLGNALAEQGKYEEAKRIYDELQSPDPDALAAQIARYRRTEVETELQWKTKLPEELAKLAKNAPALGPMQVNPDLGQQEPFGPPREAMETVTPPKQEDPGTQGK